MRVAIDTRPLRPPLTGIGHFVHRLTSAMLPLLAANEQLLSFNGWRIQPLDQEFLARAEMRNSSAGPEQSMWTFRHVASKGSVFLRQMSPDALRAARFHSAEKNFDLFHAVNYVPPGAPHKPVLPFIHDLSHIRYPQTHPKERVEWLEQQLKLLADVPYVQTNSEFSKSEIVAVLGVSSNRIYVTYAAPGMHFRPDRDGDEAWLAKCNLAPRKYFLFVGTREPRKNFKTVAEAHTALPVAMQAQLPLIWVGPPGWGELSLSPAAERGKDQGLIRMIGYVPDRELAALYRNTALFVMPSIYEGFGMPVVEAMVCGARIALSRIPVFEEIAGSYARFVDPMDVEGWRQAMKDAIEEGRGTPTARGVQPDLARFSWHSSAATTLDLYRRLALAADRRRARLTRETPTAADSAASRS
jgi:alpha-1,3-rhamnosyl/mannosyltransferase